MPHLQPYHRATLLTSIRRRMRRDLRGPETIYRRGDNDDNGKSLMIRDDDDVCKDSKAFETDESASTPPTSPHHIIFFLRPNPVQYGCLFNTILHDHHLLRHALPSLLLHYLHHYHHHQRILRVRASKPKTMQDAIEFVTKLMDKKISTPAERQAENKRELGTGEETLLGPTQTLCLNPTITMMVHVLPNATSATELAIWPVIGMISPPKERKNQNHENQTGGTRARGVVHAFGGGETEQDLNNIEDEIDA
ncbi:hypothetical protein Tco_1041317 [Tanacetum coccineum]|uniref:Uncharacterized protein n=1 Tax=Tanacetum coccineum TaxID=301880 RepID=A0ABQ5GI31_9ASTR